MTTRPPRPILHLKPGVEPPAPWTPEPLSRPKPPAAKKRPPPPPPPQQRWKCRPCGATFTPADDLADTDAVRCPACNARLGLAADFRADPPVVERLRARPLKG